MKRFVTFACGLALAACSGDSGFETFCGDTTWGYSLTGISNPGFITGGHCFEVDEGERTAIRIGLVIGGDCEMAGTLSGTSVALDDGECVVESIAGMGTGLETFSRWFITGGTATKSDNRWVINALADVALVVHEGAFANVDVERGSGTIDLTGDLGGGTHTFDNSYGHPCTPGARYGTTITGRVVNAIGSMESCTMLLEQFGATATYDYTIDNAAHTISYGEADVPFALLPDACMIAFDESSDAVKSRLDLDAKQVTITTRRQGPNTSTGVGTCDLEWTGALTPK